MAEACLLAVESREPDAGFSRASLFVRATRCPSPLEAAPFGVGGRSCPRRADAGSAAATSPGIFSTAAAGGAEARRAARFRYSRLVLGQGHGRLVVGRPGQQQPDRHPQDCQGADNADAHRPDPGQAIPKPMSFALRFGKCPRHFPLQQAPVSRVQLQRRPPASSRRFFAAARSSVSIGRSGSLAITAIS